VRKMMTEQTKLALAKAYKEWRPRSGISAESLAEAHGVTKCAMYAFLRREGIPLKRGRVAPGPTRLAPAAGDLSRAMVEVLLDQLIDLKIERRALEKERLDLEARLVGKAD
jgi:hypothetical protein